MSAFKDQLKADMHNVFLNTEEFANTHIIDGKEVPAIIDEELEEYENLRSFDSDGLYRIKMVLHVSYDLLGKIPAVESKITVDGKKLFVLNVSESYGMLNLVLGVNTG